MYGREVPTLPVADGPHLLSLEAACEALACSRSTLYRLIEDQRIRRVYVRVLRQTLPRVIAEDVERVRTGDAA